MIVAAFPVPWARLSDGGEWVVLLFGMLLWAACLFSLIGLGVRAMSTGRYRSRKRRTGRRANRTS
jgi:hypothetical protein